MTEGAGSFDVVVIGAGPGGYTAAIRAQQLGLSAALVEREESLGGVCLNWGCIPTKALLKQAELYRLFRRADEFGFKVDAVDYDWDKVISRSRGVAGNLAKGVGYLMGKNKVQVFKGDGRITPMKKVEVSRGGKIEQTLSAGSVIIATGGRPQTIPGVEIDGEKVISSREAMVAAKQPASMLIIGAGAIGIEFAYFYNAFGTAVTVVEALPQVLPREDAEVAQVLVKSLEEQGIAVATGVGVTGVKSKGRKVEVRYEGDGKETVATVDKVLMAVGVRANVEGMGLEALGVRMEKGAIQVNGRLETSVKGVYAIGDVVGPPQLAHMASAEAVAAAEFIAGFERDEIDRSNIPSCTYCQPQVASVGMTEAEAVAAGRAVKVGRFPFMASGKAQAAGETDGLVKLIFDEQYGEILGAAMVGAEATELIAEVCLARKLEATYEELLHTVHAHPTLSEAVMEAAGEAYGEALNI